MVQLGNALQITTLNSVNEELEDKNIISLGEGYQLY